MPKFELSINVNYVPRWGFWEGVREHISNGKDAEAEFDAPLKVTYYNNTIRIENEGAELNHNVLLFGTSSKQSGKDFIGAYGEGLKLGTLALVRAGYPVTIRSGDEVWTPSIVHSEKYDADVLVFDVKGGNAPKKRVRVEIGNVDEKDWLDVKERFLFLTKVTKTDQVSTSHGDLLLGEKFKHKIYVKGVHIEDNVRLEHGYNLLNAEVDRDRKMVRSYDFQWEASKIWNEACATRPDLINPFFELLLAGKADVQGYEYMKDYCDKEVAGQVGDLFKGKFGDNALPVNNVSESKDINHLGKLGIVVPKMLQEVLSKTVGTLDEVKKALREEVVRRFSWHELSLSDQKNVSDVIDLLGKVRPEVTLDRIDIVEYRDQSLMGQHKDGKISIAHRLIADFDELLATLVHEFAHDYGGDGDSAHVRAIENIWRDIVKLLRSN